MRYIVVRSPFQKPTVLFWEGRTTHPSMAKSKRIPNSQISSVGYITYRRDKSDFFITWHTPYPDEQSPEITKEDIRLIMQQAREKYGHDELIKNRLANAFEKTQRANRKIINRFFIER